MLAMIRFGLDVLPRAVGNIVKIVDPED